MQAQLISYQLSDISRREHLKQMVEPGAPILANVEGLISKVWLTPLQLISSKAIDIARLPVIITLKRIRRYPRHCLIDYRTIHKSGIRI